MWLPSPDATLTSVDAAQLAGQYNVAEVSAATDNTLTRLAHGGFKRADGFSIKVGIIDTGVDYTHPALGGGFGTGFKVAVGRDFTGDAFRSGGVPMPDNDPVRPQQSAESS